MTETFTQHFLDRVAKYRDNKVAIRQKEYGIWREYTWQDSYEQVREIAMGLKVLGMQRGDHVATIGDNDKHYFWGYLGVHAIGGAIIGLYTDANAQEASYLIDNSDSKYVLAHDQEQVDKMLEIRDKIPQVQRIIYWDDSGLWAYNDPWLISFEEIQTLGRNSLNEDPHRFEEEVRQGRGDDIAIISYTSGTTGLPKGAMLSHRCLLKAVDEGNAVDPRYDSDNHVSFLPMGWIVEHLLGIAYHCKLGIVLNFPETPETVRENVREIAPETIVYSAGLWDSIVSMVQVRMLDATWLNRMMYRFCMPIGYANAAKRMRGETPNPGTRLLYWISDQLFFRPLRDQLGMSRVRTALTGGAALSPDVIRFFHAIGINLKQVYGMTEISTVGTTHPNGDIKFASVGKPMPSTDIRIHENGEIYFSTPCLFQGYYKNEEQSAEDIHVDLDGKRWFKTGDAGYIDDDGHLIYLDRVKDMIELTNGARFSPQFIEGRLKFSPYIKDVMAVGDKSKKWVAALIILEYDNVAHWAEKRGIGFTTFADLSQNRQVRDLIQSVIREVNESLPADGRIRSFVLMPKEFDADDAEMTRSRKLRRQVLVSRYHEIISALYGDAEVLAFRSEVQYQDGSSGQLQNDLHIVKV